jgi:hypothetical protein
MREEVGAFIGLVAVVMIFSIPIVAIISSVSAGAFRAWLEIALKRDMVARGYTAAEITEVLRAKGDSSSKTELPNVPPAKPTKPPAYTSELRSTTHA